MQEIEEILVSIVDMLSQTRQAIDDLCAVICADDDADEYGHDEMSDGTYRAESMAVDVRRIDDVRGYTDA